MGWHAHEMIYGYLAAIIAGFLMTAIPNWTGRLPVMGWPLALFVMVWFAGRIAMFVSGGLGAAGIDALFLLLLAGFAWREVLRGKNWRNLPICIFVSLFALGNILFHAEGYTGLPIGTGQRFGLGIAIMLISLIGGRIIPSFTINWMKKAQIAKLPAPFNNFDKMTLAATAIVVISWIILPQATLAGYGWLLIGILHSIRLARWRGWKTFPEPLVAILHVGYAWLPLTFFAMSAAIFRPDIVAPSHALHFLTAGAIGQMTMAVMTRATLGHSGYKLRVGSGTTIIYALIFLGALLRVIIPWTSFDYGLGMSIAGLFWSAAFLLFAVLYGPMLFRRRYTANTD